MSIFSKVQQNKRLKRSTFNLSHQVLTTANVGEIIPVMCEDIVPGDTWKYRTDCFARLAPMLAPVMADIDICLYNFFVPYRLIWEDSESFFTGGEDGMQEPVIPFMQLTKVGDVANTQTGSLADYLGLPVQASSQNFNQSVCTLPFRAYQLIYKEYFMDRNVDDEIVIPTASGSDSASWQKLTILRNACWRKDYFTSALPFTQRGSEVQVGFGIDDPNVYLTNSAGSQNYNMIAESNASTGVVSLKTAGAAGVQGKLSLKTSVTTNPTINELRRSIALQSFLELSARVGSRYVEYLRGVFGVTPRDARLQRPEYLGGGRQPVMISEVLQTSEGTTTSPQGNMAGRGLSGASRNGIVHFFDENGILMTLMVIRPKAYYLQGLRRYWSKKDRFEFFIPNFANLGEQEITKKELFVSGTKQNDDSLFGYTPRYAEYKFIPSTVHGDFRTSLNYWHVGRIFDTQPSLSSEFLHVDSGEMSRIFAADDAGKSDKFWIKLNFTIKARRPMPYFGTPTI